ncbi:MAG: ABC transporter substrate-binding protein [Oscillospiraceae bacterium]|nr:ABC transporter substrate-binding protein [Oscillospiraceae bacterium]
MKLIKKMIFAVVSAFIIMLSGCSKTEKIPEKHIEIDGLIFSQRVELIYAEQFAIDRYENGYSVIHTMNGESFLLVPEGEKTPDGLSESITVIEKPTKNIYLAATSAMGLFAELEQGEAVKFSGTKAGDWYIDYAREAMENGTMLYAGKYREPDYEMLLENMCMLSIQSTMIDHSPEVKDKLNELGIPVFVDYSSYETHPLGRSEWIKVYGEMTDTSELARQLFSAQAEQLDSISEQSTGKTAAFFYISTSGQAVTRKSGDYVTKMIELAGGENVFENLGDDKATSSVTMEMEQFYSQAKNADFIIYNSTIGGEITTVEQLIAKNELLADFKAVQNGNVWCTKENLFQETMKLGTVISDFNSIFTGNTENEPPVFLFRLEDGEKDD